MRCGLLGQSLAHSHSPKIHALLGDYTYSLFEVAPERLADFLQSGAFDGLNITIPYKKAVIPFCAELSPQARRLGSVNTLLRREDGSLFGDNTDYDGFAWLLSLCGGVIAGEKAVILGSGGAAATVRGVLEDAGAQVVTVSRKGPVRYKDLSSHKDASVLINATPVGMYPNNAERPVSLRQFPKLRLVLDLIYNPLRTRLLQDAEDLGIPCQGGLAMLVAQAVRASELFTGRKLPEGCNNFVLCKLQKDLTNIILIGMPGCGKTTVGRLLAQRLGRPFFDADEELIRRVGCPIEDFFARFGEPAFRQEESEVLKELGKRSGCVIATGGGCVTRAENRDFLRQNGTLVWLKRPLSLLCADGRPISKLEGVEALYRKRRALYEQFSQFAVANCGTPEDTVTQILEVLK